MEQYGISVNNDCVARTAFFKYFHPKEALIQNGILNQEVVRTGNSLPKENKIKKPSNTFLSNIIKDEDINENEKGGLSFIYPFGATLNVQQPAHAVLGSGPLSYPINRPVGAVYVNKGGKGKLAVLGSIDVFTDEYFEKEENSKLLVRINLAYMLIK